MENRSTQNDSNNIGNKDIIQNLNKIFIYADDKIQFKNGSENEQSDFVIEIEEFINQNYIKNKNNYKNGNKLSNFIKVQLMKEIYPKNENIKSYYYLELNDGETLFIEKNKEYKTITISKETYQKGEIFELDKNKKIVLIILIQTKDGKDNISLYCLDVNNYPRKNSIIEHHFKVPPIKDYSYYILDQIEQKEIIMLFGCEKEIHSFEIGFNKSNNKLDDYIKRENTYDVDELTSICLIRKIEMVDEYLEKNNLYNTGFFLVSSKSNLKLFKYDEKGNIIYICDIEIEKENNDIFNGKIDIKNIRQLDNGILTIHLGNKKFNSCLIMKEKKEKEKKDV